MTSHGLPDNYSELFAEWTRLLEALKINDVDQYYFDSILPAILPVVRQRSGFLEKYDGLISLLGFTPEPEVLSAQLIRPETLAVLHTPETESYVDVVGRYCGVPLSRFYHVQFLHDDEHVDDIYLALKEVVAKFRRGASVVRQAD